MKKPLVIVAGAPKSGTTSVYKFLADHPEICGSRIKEPAFFIKNYSSDFQKDSDFYGQYFSHRETGEHKYFLEASAGYINDATVAKKMHDFLGDNCNLIFSLRNPVDRLYSYYNFQKSRYIFPKDLGFDEYISISKNHQLIPGEIEDRHFQVLEQGQYVDYLQNFIDVLGNKKVNILIYEDFRNDNRKTMKDICRFLNIDTSFYDDYSFVSANVTTSGRIKFLHLLALKCNDIVEPLLRQRPAIKQNIVNIYKRLNTNDEGYNPMPTDIRKNLEAYYKDSVNKLEEYLQRSTAW